MLLRRLKYPNTTGLILRRTYPELERSHILKMFEEYPGLREYYNEQKKALTLPNNSTLFFGSAPHEKDMANFYSAEFADIMPDEAQEFTQGEIEKLSGSNRCTSNTDITPKMILTFMPGMSESNLPPRGLSYLKRVFADDIQQGEEKRHSWKFIQAFSWDNIEWARKELERDGVSEEEFYSWPDDRRREYFLTRTDYGITLASITDSALRDAWLYGKWDVFQGQFFPRFDRARHVISRVEARERIKPWHRMWISGDWGYDHPHAVHLHAMDEHNRVITFAEQCAREVEADELGRLVGVMCAGKKFECFPMGWDAFGKLDKKTRKPFTEMIGKAMPAGLPKPIPADSSPGSRISGARLMSQLLDKNMWQIVEEDCPKLIECIPTLVRDPKNTEDVFKVDWSENGIGDDPYDSARMGLSWMLGSVMKPERVKLQEAIARVRDQFLPAIQAPKPGEDWFEQFGGISAKGKL